MSNKPKRNKKAKRAEEKKSKATPEKKPKATPLRPAVPPKPGKPRR